MAPLIATSNGFFSLLQNQDASHLHRHNNSQNRFLVLFMLPMVLFAFAVPSPQSALAYSVTIQGIEAIQVIQDLDNSAPLIEGKSTIVRAYLQLNRERELNRERDDAKIQITAELIATKVWLGGRQTVRIPPLDKLSANARSNGRLSEKRNDIKATLNFFLPGSEVTEGAYDFSIDEFKDQRGNSVHCDNCSRKYSVDVKKSPPLRIRFVALTYELQSADGTLRVITPRDQEYGWIKSWLRRTYPTANVIEEGEGIRPELSLHEWDQTLFSSPLQPGLLDCDSFVNVQFPAYIANERYAEDSSIDARAHYVAIIADTGSPIARGCGTLAENPDPGATALVITGHPSSTFGQQIGANLWDVDQTYGDWYTAHELGHTFGRKHVQGANTPEDNVQAPFCGQEEDTDTNYPYPPHGQISLPPDSSNPRRPYFVGLELFSVKCSTSSTTGRRKCSFIGNVVPGTKGHDLLTYCSRIWPSKYTYEAIFTRLQQEDRIQILSTQSVPLDRGFATNAPNMTPAISSLVEASRNSFAENPDLYLTSFFSPIQPPHSIVLPGFTRMAKEERASASPNQALTLERGDFLYIIGSANLTKRTGKISSVIRTNKRVKSSKSQESKAMLRVTDANGDTRAYPIMIRESAHAAKGKDRVIGIEAVLPYPTGTSVKPKKLELFVENSPVAALDISDNEPQIKEIRLPKALTVGDLDMPLAVEWAADDQDPSDNSKLSYTVYVSTDKGATWQLIATRQPSSKLFIDPRRFRNASSIKVRVVASDGFYSQEKTSELLPVPQPANNHLLVDRSERRENTPRSESPTR